MKHPRFEFDRRRFLGLAAGRCKRGGRSAVRRLRRGWRRRATQDRDDRRWPRRRGARHALRQAGPSGNVLLEASRASSRTLVASAGPTAQAGTVEQAVKFGDVILLVVPYTAVEQIGKDYGKALAAKPLVIDVSNPIARRDGDAIVNWVSEQGGAGLATAKLLAWRASRARLQCDQLPQADRGRASVGRTARRTDRERRPEGRSRLRRS